MVPVIHGFVHLLPIQTVTSFGTRPNREGSPGIEIKKRPKKQNAEQNSIGHDFLQNGD